MNKKVIILGASGHGKVIADIVIKSEDKLVGFLDDGIEKNTEVIGYKVLGKISDAYQYEDCEFVIGIGSNEIRKKISHNLQLRWYTAIHPTVQIALDVNIGEGTVIMANSVINTSTKIGKHCIINTSSIIEHDNYINDYVHISPNSTLCGTVHIGKLTHIGAGTTIRNNISITDNCIIGAGSVVVKNIDDSGTYVGVPVRRMNS